jgi:hypothetical protein|tara:strand:- start:474 stop:701 length:228 start_codon:yes stop_codon:yes gene_type:complete
MKKSINVSDLKTLEKELRVKLESYVGKRTMIDEVIPHDLDELFEIVKNNPNEFEWMIDNIRGSISIYLQKQIGLR